MPGDDRAGWATTSTYFFGPGVLLPLSSRERETVYKHAIRESYSSTFSCNNKIAQTIR
jgi:hypothetical protein